MDKELLDYIKVLSLKDKKTLSQKALKVSEETGELARVVLPFDNAHGTTHRFIEKNKILEECVDVMLTAISIAYELGYSHDDVEEAMWDKAMKWQGIQTKAEKIDGPIPYEIHITVKIVDEAQITLFKNLCEKYEVKPIVLDLENSGKSVMKDVMTSSHHFGTNTSAYYEATRIRVILEMNGFIVVRTKIETVPWHPAAPQSVNEVMPKDCHFEAHISCIITEKQVDDLTFLAKCNDAHISRNFFKKLDGDKFVNMITLRKYDCDYPSFIEYVESLKEVLTYNHFEYEKVITEFSIYDTKVSHDFLWLDKTK